MTSLQKSFLAELEHVIDIKSVGDRAAALRRVADLFVVSSDKLTEEQVAVFDDVMGCLLAEIESSARAAFGHLLATVPNAPRRVVRMLALDDAIEVAGAILTHSEQVDDETLVESARTASQAHLLAISRRRTLTEPVTDALVECGERQVALSTAGNPGASFSEFGYSSLVQRSSDDDDLAMCVWARPEIPRKHLLKLFADASEAVKLKLTSKDPGKARLVLEIVAQASQQIRSRVRTRSPEFAAAEARIQALYAAGGLGEPQLAELTRTGNFDETSVALALICDLPIALVENALVDEEPEQTIVIARAAGFSWQTTKAILRLQSLMRNRPATNFDRSFETFTRLKVETAKKVIQFYRLRQRAVAGARPMSFLDSHDVSSSEMKLSVQAARSTV